MLQAPATQPPDELVDVQRSNTPGLPNSGVDAQGELLATAEAVAAADAWVTLADAGAAGTAEAVMTASSPVSASMVTFTGNFMTTTFP